MNIWFKINGFVCDYNDMVFAGNLSGMESVSISVFVYILQHD